MNHNRPGASSSSVEVNKCVPSGFIKFRIRISSLHVAILRTIPTEKTFFMSSKEVQRCHQKQEESQQLSSLAFRKVRKDIHLT